MGSDVGLLLLYTKAIIAFLLFTPVSGLYAQKIKVLNIDTGDPLEYANVFCLKNKKGGITDKDGILDLTILNKCKNLEVTLIGYKSLTLDLNNLLDTVQHVFLTPSNLYLNEIVVSSTRWKNRKRENAQPIATIRKSDISFQNPQSAADMLDISGKIFIQKSQQGGGSPMIRGFSANRLLYSVDGIRMNTAIFRSGNIHNVISLDPFTIDQSEVVFGPGSVLYGSDAIGGVLNFITLKPHFTQNSTIATTINGTMRYNTANHEKTGHIDLSISNSKFSYISSLSINEFDHLKMGSNGPNDYLNHQYVTETNNGRDSIVENPNPLIQIPSAYSQLNFMQKIAFKANKNAEWNYALHYSTTSEFGRYDRHQRVQNGLPRYAVWNYGPQKWMMNAVSFNFSKDKSFIQNGSIKVAHQNFKESRITRNFNSKNLITRDEQVHALSLNADFTKLYTSSSSLFYGVEWVYNRVNSIGKLENIETNMTSDFQSRYPNSHWYSTAVYLNYHLNIFNNLKLQTGLRYNIFKINSSFENSFLPISFSDVNTSFSNVSSSFGLIYQPLSNLLLSTHLSTGFRAPNVDDIGKVFDSEPGSVVVPNPELKEEVVNNIDFSAVYVFDNLLKCEVSLFASRLNNAMVRRDYTLDGRDSIIYDGVMSRIQAIQNASFTNVYGVQAGVEFSFFKYFHFSSNINFQKGTEQLYDGSQSPSRHAPPLYGKINLEFINKSIKVSLGLPFQGSFDYDQLPISERSKTEIYALDDFGRPFAPSWFKIDLNCRYKLSKKIEINFGIDNLWNKRYRTYSSGISAAGRSAVLALNFKV